MLEVAGLVITAVGVVFGFFTWIDPEIQRVRRALRDEGPDLDMAVTSAGPPAQLLTTITNRGSAAAHNLVLGVSGVNEQWRRQSLAPAESTTAQMALDRDPPIRRAELDNPKAELRFENRFGHLFSLTVMLTQAPRADGFYNIGSRPGLHLARPNLSRWALWKLRTQT